MRLKFLMRSVAFLWLSLFANDMCAQTYSLQVGESLTLNVPSAKVGYVDKAIWACANPAVSFVSKSTSSATITITKQFEGYATIELLYVEKYVDGKGFTRANTYTTKYYVSCKYSASEGSTVAASTISVTPEIRVAVGEKAKIYYDLYPMGSTATVYGKGYPGTYFNSLTFYRNEGYVQGWARTTGVDEIKLYFYNKNDEEVSARCKVVVYDPTWIDPQGISLQNVFIANVGQQKKLLPYFTPSNSNALLEWSSSNATIASISNGTLKAKKEGITKITLTTSNGLVANCSVIVLKEEDMLPGINSAVKRCADMLEDSELENVK